MAKLITIIHLLFLNTAYAKTYKVYLKEVPPRVEVQDEQRDIDCTNSSAPYVVLSKADKKKLEDFVKNKHVEDPNLALP